MKLIFTPRAKDDLIEIADYLRPRNPQGARRVRSAILRALQTVVQFPQSGRKQTTPGVRKVVALKYPYLIYYTADESAGQIAVLSIRHSGRERVFEDA